VIEEMFFGLMSSDDKTSNESQLSKSLT
jgi:hypothetical protein